MTLIKSRYQTQSMTEIQNNKPVKTNKKSSLPPKPQTKILQGNGFIVSKS